jgi:hypothetical protein
MGHHEVVGRDETIRRRARIRRTLGTSVVLAVVVTGCVGSVDREEFNRIVEERGGGLSQALVLDAVASLEAELDVDPLLVQSITVTNETVTIEAVSPEFPDEIDRYTFRGGDLDGPEPASQFPEISIPELPEGVEIPPELQDLVDGSGATDPATAPGGTFPVDDVALDQLDDLVDAAIETADLRGGYATTLVITSLGGEGPRIRVSVTNVRQDVTVTYGPDGQPLEVS